jgi:hypothetical protein
VCRLLPSKDKDNYYLTPPPPPPPAIAMGFFVVICHIILILREYSSFVLGSDPSTTDGVDDTTKTHHPSLLNPSSSPSTSSSSTLHQQENSNNHEENYQIDEEGYEDISWNNLPSKYRIEVQYLGYTETLWNDYNGRSYLDVDDTSSLNYDEQMALKLLNCYYTFDSQSNNNGGFKSLDECLFRTEWEELTEIQQFATRLLGYTRGDWEDIIKIRKETRQKKESKD